MSFVALVGIAYVMITRAYRLVAMLTRLALAVVVALLAVALAGRLP